MCFLSTYLLPLYSRQRQSNRQSDGRRTAGSPWGLDSQPPVVYTHSCLHPRMFESYLCLRNTNDSVLTPSQYTPDKPRNKTSGNKQTGKHQQLRHRRNGAQLSRPTLCEIISKYILECPAQYIFGFTQRTTPSLSPSMLPFPTVRGTAFEIEQAEY